MVTGKYIKVGWDMSRVRVVVCCVGDEVTQCNNTETVYSEQLNRCP